jgi:hypothetical protein
MCLAPKEPEIFVSLVMRSENVKTGSMPVATISNASCPPSCPFIGHGCYAGYGKASIHWRRVSRGERGVNWQTFCNSVAKEIFPTQIWRYGQAGDLPHKAGKIDTGKLNMLVLSNKGKRGYGYTHHELNDHNVKALRHANTNGLTLNVSCETPEKVDRAASLGLPAVTVLPASYGRTKDESLSDYMLRMKGMNLVTPEGNKVWICPATYQDNMTCKVCKVCAIPQRFTAGADPRAVIPGFPAHGVGKKYVYEIAKTWLDR